MSGATAAAPDLPTGPTMSMPASTSPVEHDDDAQMPQRGRRRTQLAALWLFFALGLAGTVELLVVGGRGTDASSSSSPRGLGGVAPARVMLGPLRTPKAEGDDAAPRCCTTEYGQPGQPAAAEAAVFGVGSPGHWGGFAALTGQPTDAGVEAQLLRAAAAAAGANGSTDAPPEPPLDGAAYLVVTSARDEVGFVEAVLARVDGHFARLHAAYPVVVFWAGAAPLGPEEEARLRAAAPHTRLELRSVDNLQQLAAAATATAPGNASSTAAAWAYARALWEFRVAAPRLLAEEGREWVLHLSEETLLDDDVVLDPFLALKASGRKLGYTTAHRGLNEEGLWAFGRAFAQQHQTPRDAAFFLTKDAPKALDGRWIAFHRSVVMADQYQALVVGLASSNLTQSLPPDAVPGKHQLEYVKRLERQKQLLFLQQQGGPVVAALRRGAGAGGRRAQQFAPPPRAMAAVTAAGEEEEEEEEDAVARAVEALPQEAAVLTLGALLGLRPADFLQYQGITLQRPPPGRGGPTSVEGAPPTPSAGGATVSQWRDLTITAAAAEDLQPLFDVRREGWLGADVATSFRLPPRRDDERPEEGRYLWLFGDTLVGRASPDKRRRGAYFIHNSVAFLPAFNSSGPPPTPADVAFAWNVSKGGCPASVFVRRHLDDECQHQEEYLWPISGISASYNGEARVVVLAVRWAYVTPAGAGGGVDLFSDDAFNFKILGTTAIVVDNPHDAPQAWRYRQKDIPGTDENLNWYSAMLHETKGAEVAMDPEDRVYLFGVNTTVAPGTTPQAWQYETLARIPISGLVDLTFEGMEVWAHRHGRRGASPPPMPTPAQNGSSGGDDKAHWVPYRSFLRRCMWAAPLVFPVFSETSVHYSEALGAWYGVVVDWLSTQILLYVSEELTGPWEAVPCYKLPPPFDDPSLYMSYAGKAHPELALGAEGDEIILTYMTNAPGDLEPLFEAGALDVYVPRFVRLRLERVTPATALALATPAKAR